MANITPSKRKSHQEESDVPCEVVAVQPVGIMDHVSLVDAEFLKNIKGDIGGSARIDASEVKELLSSVDEFSSKAGGSASNTARGLADGFDVRCSIVGAVGDDEWGTMFLKSMKRSGVETRDIRKLPGSTGRCVCLVGSDAQRTMRPNMVGAARLAASDLKVTDFKGAKWAIFNGYAFYGDNLLEEGAKLAVQAGCKVALHLASFEVVRTFHKKFLEVLSSGLVSAVFANEDETVEMARHSDPKYAFEGTEEPTVQLGIDLMAESCELVVCTVGERGCIVKKAGEEQFEAPAEPRVKVMDTTGAGDLFSSGFIYGLLRDYPLRRCAEIGNYTGAAVVQGLGAEVSPALWSWLHAKIHGERAGDVVRSSAEAVQKELLECYALIEKMGRGVVYYGSARLKADSPHFQASIALSKRLALLLGVTTWSGGGPGMMHAASIGAQEAGRPVAGIRIAREAGTTVKSLSYLAPDAQVMCRFLSSRKVALTDCGVRKEASDRTAYVFLPGGLGTMDEFFEILTLLQLKKLGTKHPVPVLLLNYGGCYDGLVQFIKGMMEHGTVGQGEFNELKVFNTNEEAVDYLKEIYGIVE